MAGGRLSGAERAELVEIVRSRSFKTGSFTLSSGKTSSLYFNLKPTMLDPRGAELSARALLDIAEATASGYVSGLEMGAVPVIGSLAALGSSEGRPVRATFVRKQPKGHGTKDVIEGLGPDETLEGRRVLVIDDVATSGASTLVAIERIREVGGIVEHAACLLNRQEGGEELLADHGVALHSVLSASDFTGG
ncbi:MAG: orotate phosphoribosyltransferase [Alphaproteobacteria bacterium]|nr:MAG: orotate phosphoribosyltransferase [Alphaproteobacteria bacterium]